MEFRREIKLSRLVFDKESFIDLDNLVVNLYKKDISKKYTIDFKDETQICHNEIDIFNHKYFQQKVAYYVKLDYNDSNYNSIQIIVSNLANSRIVIYSKDDIWFNAIINVIEEHFKVIKKQFFLWSVYKYMFYSSIATLTISFLTLFGKLYFQVKEDLSDDLLTVVFAFFMTCGFGKISSYYPSIELNFDNKENKKKKKFLKILNNVFVKFIFGTVFLGAIAAYIYDIIKTYFLT